MNYFFRRTLAALAACAVCSSANATIIEYDVTNIAGNNWRYDYFVTNDSLGAALDEFTVFFELGLYENVALGGAPLDWDPIVAEPDPNLPDDGYYDALALVTGIAPGAKLDGFFVTFDWLGIGTPGSQPFDVVDATTIETLDSGFTRLRALTPPPVDVPEPAGLTLMATMLLLGLGSLRSRNRNALL